MKPFVFRLARLAAVRSAEERLALGEWARAESAVQHARRAESEIESRIEQARRDMLETRSSGSIDPSRALADDRAVDSLAIELRRRRETTRTLTFQAAELRQAFEEARRSVRALELLERRDREAHVEAQARAEQVEMDETAAKRWESRKTVQEPLRESGARTDDWNRTLDASEAHPS